MYPPSLSNRLLGKTSQPSIKPPHMTPLDADHVPQMFAQLATGRESSDRVLYTILEEMLEGRYKPGDRVNARQLAEKLDVSIVPVREAIHVLAGEGVVELQPNKGAKIRSMDRREVANWWEILGTIGKLGIKLAAERIGHDEANPQRVRDAMELIKDSVRQVSPFEFVLVLVKYHEILHEVAENQELNEAVRRLQVFFWAFFFPDYLPVADYWDIYVRNHQRVTDAILCADAAGAEAAYQYHIDWTDALLNGDRPDPNKPWIPYRVNRP